VFIDAIVFSKILRGWWSLLRYGLIWILVDIAISEEAIMRLSVEVFPLVKYILVPRSTGVMRNVV
jgi:hypothetical protein